MKTQIRNTNFWVLGLVVAFLAGPANADTLPAGATPISGSVAITRVGTDSFATLPFDVPDGQVFVLTDLEVARLLGGATLQILAPEDPDTPRLLGLAQPQSGSASYQRIFQTGLVFSTTPTIKFPNCSISCPPDARVSYSGYFKADRNRAAQD
jgi:hypothetical protein